jgi:DNA-binding response OmpR family regulator
LRKRIADESLEDSRRPDSQPQSKRFDVPKTRKYRCCIRIESAKENGQVKLLLFIKGRQLEAPTEKHTALLDCLHRNRGHLVTYQQLGLILGHKTFRNPQLHILRQYVSWIGKTLAAHKALCILAVAPGIGYVLCEHE